MARVRRAVHGPSTAGRLGSSQPGPGLLAGRLLTVPEAFDRHALDAVRVLARGGDRLLADALTRALDTGRLAQDLAGAPELLHRYEQAGPASRALLEAAMDARRLGVGLHLPRAFLADAAVDYLADHDWGQRADNWAEAAFADLARPVHGKQAPLRRVNARAGSRPPVAPAPTPTPRPDEGLVFRLADYLEHHGRVTRGRICPPASFWHAAHTHLTSPDDLNALAEAALNRYRYRWAHHLRRRVAEVGDPELLVRLAKQRSLGPRDVKTFYQAAADAGHPDAAFELARDRELHGDREGAEALYRQAADSGRPRALTDLARLRLKAGDQEGSEALYRGGRPRPATPMP